MLPIFLSPLLSLLPTNSRRHQFFAERLVGPVCRSCPFAGAKVSVCWLGWAVGQGEEG